MTNPGPMPLPAKPSAIKQVAPWVIALAILVYMFWKIDFQGVGQALERARISWILAAYLVYCVFYYAADVLSFWRTYNWFNVPIGVAETARLRFASYTVQAVNGALTEVMSVLYMFRVKKAPVLSSIGSAGFIYFNETLTVVFFLTFCAFFLPADYRPQQSLPGTALPFWTLFQILTVVAWALVPLWIAFWRTGLSNRLPRLRDAEVMKAFKGASVSNYLEVFGYRLVNNGISLAANIVMLKALGIHAPLELLIAVIPIMVMVAYMPVSAGGFGGPQLVADIFLKGYASRDEIFAYTLVWSTLFLLSRTLTGLAFVGPVYKAAFPPAAPNSPKRPST